MILTGNLLKLRTEKRTEKRFSLLHKKNSWTQRFWKQQINISPANSTNWAKQDLKKSNQIKTVGTLQD